MKVLHLSSSDLNGGAARASMRLHQALLKIGIDSELWVDEKISDLPTVFQPESRLDRILTKIRPYLGQLPKFFSKKRERSFLSFALLPSKWVKRINRSNADLVHLHWINREMLSIRDIRAIKKPIVWTFHDMWPFCGAEHYSENDDWETGYSVQVALPALSKNHVLDRWVWNRKNKYWCDNITIVAPSKWLADCTQRSPLTSKWQTKIIPNGLDTTSWTPIDRVAARQILKLPIDKKLILFGALGGHADKRKGFSLLRDALEHLRESGNEYELVIFGQSRPSQEVIQGFITHYMGHLHDDASLRLTYSAANVMVVPSRQEVFGQTATEALACGTPITAFNIGGLKDIVDHGNNGYLATPYDTLDLQKCIIQAIALSRLQDSQTRVANSIRDKVLDTNVARLHENLYQRVILNSCHPKS